MQLITYTYNRKDVNNYGRISEILLLREQPSV